MKTVKVSVLKAHLSEYLRLAARGAKIIVKDRDEPIAQLGPLDQKAVPWRDRLSHAGRLRRGSQNWAALPVSPLGRVIDIQASLDAVRDDPRASRRRR